MVPIPGFIFITWESFQRTTKYCLRKFSSNLLPWPSSVSSLDSWVSSLSHRDGVVCVEWLRLVGLIRSPLRDVFCSFTVICAWLGNQGKALPQPHPLNKQRPKHQAKTAAPQERKNRVALGIQMFGKPGQANSCRTTIQTQQLLCSLCACIFVLIS